MQWWNDFVDWLYSDEGWSILTSVVFPFLAIVVAGFIAALIGRGSTKRLLTHHDREQRVSTVSALIGAARRASTWNTLSNPEQEHADHLAHDADVSMRLLPLAGATMTADWAAHKIDQMKKDSVSFSFQAEQSLLDVRDRLVAWQERPGRAKKLFKADLDLWAYESAQADKGLVEKQQEWAKQQVAAETGPVSTVAPTTAAPAATTAAPAVPPQSPTATWNTPSASPISPSAPSTAATSPAATSPAAASPPASPVTATPVTSSTATGAPANTGGVPAQDASADIVTPSPVSAQSVRQRILPDNYDGDDQR